jgi:hypothetical protein
MANAGVIPTIAELRALAKKYQERLRLNLWTITVRFGKGKEMPGLCGFVDWYDADAKIASIVVKRDHQAVATLRHEFMHIHLEARTDEHVKNDPEYEAALDVVAERILA